MLYPKNSIYGAAKGGGGGVARSSPYGTASADAQGQPDVNGFAPEGGFGDGSPDQACQFFAKAGWCKFGEQCRYAHIGEQRDREVCQFFEKTGWCKWADQCRHLHVGGPNAAAATAAGGPPATDDLFAQLLNQAYADQPQDGAPGEVCQFFQKAGWCKWGDGCKYVHSGGPEPGAGPPGQVQEVCQFFAKAGWCKWMDQCKYIHAYAGPPVDNSRPPAGQLALPGPGVSQVCEFFAKAGWCKWGEGCKYIHAEGAPRAQQPPTLLTRSSTVCKYFASPGGCKNGNTCPFAHIGTPGQQEVCQFFQKAGWCKWNDQCKYLHALGPDTPVQPLGALAEQLEQTGLPQGLEVCQFFAKAAWCKWGEGCKYIHAMPAAPEAFEQQPVPGLAQAEDNQQEDELVQLLASHPEQAT